MGDVMLPGGAKPAPWGSPGVIPPKCQSLGGPNAVVIRMAGKTPNVLSATNQPFKTGPLIDQRGFYARFELLMNKPMFDYIVTNTLYSKQGQQNFSGTVAFPPGNVDKRYDRHDRRHHGQGGLEGDGPERQSAAIPQDRCAGLHAAFRRSEGRGELRQADAGPRRPAHGAQDHERPQWLWSTFEHVKNAPTQADVNAKKLRPPYNFYNANCSTAKCRRERAAAASVGSEQAAVPRRIQEPGHAHHSADQEVLDMNASFQGLLKGTVWANYMLISTQWPTNATSKTDPTGLPAPTYLANTTLETYIQGKVPQSSSNCIACHNNATTLHTPATPSDFTYILENAK